MGKNKIRLTIRQHNKLFKYRQVKFFTYYEIIDDPEKPDIEMHQYIRFPVRILTVVFSPLVILVGGVPAMISLVKECLFKKSVGSDTINREWLYKQLGDT